MRVPLNIAYAETDAPGPLVEPESSVMEVGLASLAQGFMSTETNSIYRSIKLALTDREDDVTDHVELNKRFPNVEVPFNEPTSLAVAEEISRRATERQAIQKVIEEGDQESLFVKAVSFGANLIPQALDPVGLASGVLVGAGVNKALGMMGTLGKAAAKPGIIRSMAEGVAGNVISELAIVQPATRFERGDVDTYESLSNAFWTGLTFPVVTGVMGKIYNRIKGGPNGANHVSKTVALAEAQMEMGKKVDLHDFNNAAAQMELPGMRSELDRLGQEPDAAKRASAEEAVKDLEESVPVDRVAAAEKANSVQADLYHDVKAQGELDLALRELEPPDRTTEIKESFEEADTALKELEKEEQFSEAELEEIKLVRQEFAQIEKVDEAIKAAFHCVRGN